MNLLLLKLPYCRHPEAPKPRDFRATNSYRPMPSLALAALTAFLKTYGPQGLCVQAIDLNMALYQGHDMSQSDPEEALCENSYDVLGISGAFSHNIRWLRDAVAGSKAANPNAKIVVGGPVASAALGAELAAPVTILPGEGEFKLLDRLSGAALYGAEDFGLRDNLEALPIPAWDEIPGLDHYFNASSERVLPIEASRGCPQGCSYCTVTDTWGPRVRYKSTHQVMREILVLHNRYGVEKVHFVDDNLAFNREWFSHFLELYRLHRISVQLDASNFSLKQLDAGLADKMVACGFKRISVAVESASPEIQRLTGKRLNLAAVPAQIEMLRHAGLMVHVCWMVGFPSETREQIESTFKLAAELGADSNQFLTVVPYPGTRMYLDAADDDALADGFNLDELECRGARPFKGQEWDYDWLEGRVYDTNIALNFLKADPGEKQLREILANHPGHVIAEIMLGALAPAGAPDRANWWQQAKRHLATPEGAIFKRYLNAAHPAIQEFAKEIKP